MNRRRDSPLQQELASRGLCSENEAMRRLNIDFDAYRMLCKSGQLQRAHFDWKGYIRRGVPLSELDGRTVIYHGGSLRLVRAP
jgi:hypothetical protein